MIRTMSKLLYKMAEKFLVKQIRGEKDHVNRIRGQLNFGRFRRVSELSIGEVKRFR